MPCNGTLGPVVSSTEICLVTQSINSCALKTEQPIRMHKVLAENKIENTIVQYGLNTKFLSCEAIGLVGFGVFPVCTQRPYFSFFRELQVLKNKVAFYTKIHFTPYKIIIKLAAALHFIHIVQNTVMAVRFLDCLPYPKPCTCSASGVASLPSPFGVHQRRRQRRRRHFPKRQNKMHRRMFGGALRANETYSCVVLSVVKFTFYPKRHLRAIVFMNMLAVPHSLIRSNCIHPGRQACLCFMWSLCSAGIFLWPKQFLPAFNCDKLITMIVGLRLRYSSC